jgi:hypothetical protein
MPPEHGCFVEGANPAPADLDLRWTPLSSARPGLVLFGWVMVVLLEPGGRRDGNDNWSP